LANSKKLSVASAATATGDVLQETQPESSAAKDFPKDSASSSPVRPKYDRAGIGIWCLHLVALAGLVALTIACFSSIRSAIEIGEDEYFEVTKGLLWSKGYPMYEKVWNDQPPLFTVLMGILFKCFGADISVARGLAVFFGLLLAAGCLVIVKGRSGWLAGYGAMFSLIVAPRMLEMGVSAMLEVPAMALALWSLWPIEQWRKSRRWQCLAWSGLLMATAFQTKLTAAMLVPPLALEIVLSSLGANARASVKNSFWNLGIWGLSFLSGFLILGLLLGNDYRRYWTSHFTNSAMYLNEAKAFAFFLPAHPEAVCAVIMAFLICAWRRDWRKMAFPFVALLTAAVVHSHHRPYWEYYYVHFAVPLAWLSGYAIGELFQAAGDAPRLRFVPPSFVRIVFLLAGSTLVSIAASKGGTRLTEEIHDIRAQRRTEQSGVLEAMNSFRDQTRWAYSTAPIYVFHAKLLMIPEVAVVPLKRFWSGDLTEQDIVKIVRRYHPEQVLFRSESMLPEMTAYLKENYVIAYDDDRHALWVTKEVWRNAPAGTHNFKRTTQ
jgi:hypothetical protein